MSVIMMDLAPLVLQDFLGKSTFLERIPIGLYMNTLMFPLAAQKEITVLRYTSFCALFCIGYFFVCLIIKFFEESHIESDVVAVGIPSEALQGLLIISAPFFASSIS